MLTSRGNREYHILQPHAHRTVHVRAARTGGGTQRRRASPSLGADLRTEQLLLVGGSGFGTNFDGLSYEPTRVNDNPATAQVLNDPPWELRYDGHREGYFPPALTQTRIGHFLQAHPVTSSPAHFTQITDTVAAGDAHLVIVTVGGLVSEPEPAPAPEPGAQFTFFSATI